MLLTLKGNTMIRFGVQGQISMTPLLGRVACAALLSGLLYAGVGLLCLIYAVSLIGLLSGLIPNPGGGGADFSTIAGVRSIFTSDAGVAIGWTHYLAFDLFIGIDAPGHA
jgi:hypothetical protein